MGRTVIKNPRPQDMNVMRRRVRPSNEPFPFSLPATTVRTKDERDAVVAALETFISIVNLGLTMPNRDPDKDAELVGDAKEVLKRLI